MADDGSRANCVANLNTGSFNPPKYRTKPGATFTVEAILEDAYPTLIRFPVWLTFESAFMSNEGKNRVVRYTFTVRPDAGAVCGTLDFGPPVGKDLDKTSSGTIDVSGGNEG